MNILSAPVNVFISPMIRGNTSSPYMRNKTPDAEPEQNNNQRWRQVTDKE
jgi:hypothetical protein